MLLTKMNVQTIDINDSLWPETLRSLTHDVYHVSEYVALEAKRTNTQPEAFLVTEGDKVFFLPYLVRSCNDILDGEPEIFDVISPYGYPGILLSGAAQESTHFVDLAFKELKQTWANKGICSAFIRLHPILSDRFIDIFPPDTFTDNGETVSIDLTLSAEKIWAHTRKGHQSTINKCGRLGLTAKTVPVAEYLDQFLPIYTETMNRVAAKASYYFNQDYFTGLLKLGDNLHLCVVESAGEIVCASLFFESCGIVQAHLGGTKSEFMKQSPFNLLLHHARLWAKERGNEFLHIGGGVGGNKDKLFTFKSGFSRQRHQFLTLRLIVDESKYNYLVEARAKELNIESSKLFDSDFFPAYRATCD